MERIQGTAPSRSSNAARRQGSGTLLAPPRFTVRSIMLALATLLVTAVLAVALVLAASGGDDHAGATNSAVTPSAPKDYSKNAATGDIQRSQPPGVNGTGAHP
jgi:hypothetical protein